MHSDPEKPHTCVVERPRKKRKTKPRMFECDPQHLSSRHFLNQPVPPQPIGFWNDLSK